MINSGLEGKTVIVTGANHGIGAFTAIAFAKEGAKVLITYLRQSPELYGETQTNVEQATVPGRAYYCREIGKSAEHVVDEIRTLDGECMAWEADLSDPNTIPKLFDKAEERWGAVDVIVNNAAFDTPDTFLPQPVLDKDPLFVEEYYLKPLTALFLFKAHLDFITTYKCRWIFCKVNVTIKYSRAVAVAVERIYSERNAVVES